MIFTDFLYLEFVFSWKKFHFMVSNYTTNTKLFDIDLPTHEDSRMFQGLLKNALCIAFGNGSKFRKCSMYTHTACASILLVYGRRKKEIIAISFCLMSWNWTYVRCDIRCRPYTESVTATKRICARLLDYLIVFTS